MSIKTLWNKARKSFTMHTATIITIMGVIQANIGALNLTPSQQGKALIIIGFVVALARMRPKNDKS